MAADVLPFAVTPVQAIEGLTYRDVARLLKTSPKTVRGWPVKRVRLGHRTVRIMPDDLLAFLRGRAR